MNRRPIEVHPEAIAEARAARQWYEEQSLAAGRAFMAELDAAIEQISAAPNRWAAYLQGTRRYLMHRFPYMVIYHEKDGAIRVVAVAHARRRPGYWRLRLKSPP